MADNEIDYRHYAGRVVFPRTLDDLTSVAACPACFTPITLSVCPVCSLDLANPRLAELAQQSTDVAAGLERRLTLIGHIRYETAAAAPAVAAPPPPVAAEPAPPSGQPLFPAAPLPEHPQQPHRSGVQVALLIVGISLLSIAAIFFLVYAFITFGLVARSLIIGGITVAAIVASALIRRRLPATSEGIAVLALVLVYLDVWALRANDFFGLAAADPVGYWGTALLVTGVLAVVWQRARGPRTAGIVGAAAAAIGFALVIGWATSQSFDEWAGFAFASGLALTGSLQRIAGSVAERVVVVAIGATGVLLTSIGTIVMPLSTGSGAATNLLVGFILAVVAAVTVFASGRDTFGSRLSSVVLAIAAVVPAVVLAGNAVIVAIAGVTNAWTIGATDVVIDPGDGEPLAVTALITLVLLAALSALALHLTGRLRAHAGTFVTGGAAILVLGAATIPSLALVLVAWLLIAGAALALGMRFGDRLRGGARSVALATMLTAAGLAALTGWASAQTWQWASLEAVVILLFARMLVSGHASKAILLGVALVLGVIGAGGGARSLALPLHPGPGADAVNTAHATGFLGILVLGVSAYLVAARVTPLDRRVSFWIALPTIVASTAITSTILPIGVATGSLLLPEYVTSLVVALFLIAALASWAISAATHEFPLERATTVAALPVAVALLVDALARTIGVDNLQRAVAIVVVLSVVHVATGIAVIPNSDVAAWSSIVTAGVAGLVEFGLGALPRIEYVSIPIGIALIVTGAIHLRRASAARSWAWLAPGVSVLLVPSLIATAFDAPLWRIVGLGIVGVAVIVVAALLRLQAPLLIASVVVLIHAIATFAPEIRAVYELVEWWVWLAAGGVVILALSIRFEWSRRGVKRVVSRIAELR